MTADQDCLATAFSVLWELFANGHFPEGDEGDALIDRLVAADLVEIVPYSPGKHGRAGALHDGVAELKEGESIVYPTALGLRLLDADDLANPRYRVVDPAKDGKA